jgi:hypothetical protein
MIVSLAQDFERVLAVEFCLHDDPLAHTTLGPRCRIAALCEKSGQTDPRTPSKARKETQERIATSRAAAELTGH